MHQFREARFGNRASAGIQGVNFVTIDVHADHTVPVPAKTSGRHASDIPRAEHGDFTHEFTP